MSEKYSMIDELVLGIKEAERKAEEIIRHSGVTAKDAINKATVESQELLAKAAKEIKELTISSREKAEKQAEKEVSKVIAKANETASHILESTKSDIASATDYVVRRITQKYASN